MHPRLFAIGDIHGNFDELVMIIDWIEKHSGLYRLVSVGDLVDRGPKSKEVVQFFMDGPRRRDDEWIVIKGNHEDMMLQYIDDRTRDNWDWWGGNGGVQTLKSYGDERQNSFSPISVPQQHIDWLRALPVYHEEPYYWFVHGGVFPNLHPRQHKPEVLMWMRRWEFDELPTAYAKHVVYGHTPQTDVLCLEHCTNLDTASCYGGKLTAAEFDPDRGGNPIRLIQVDVVTKKLTVKDMGE